MHQAFTVKKEKPIYDPELFREFCIEAGAKTIFDNILKGMTAPRHSKARIQLNKKLTVSIIYNLCHGLSQQTNHLQRNFTSQLRLSGTSQRVISAARQMGITTTCRTGMRDSRKKSESNMDKVNSAIQEALDSGHLIICIIDDYHHYHAIRRPDNSTKTSSGADMCTTVIRIFPSIPAILRTDTSRLHNPEGVDIDRLEETMTSVDSMQRLGQTFANSMPNWMTSSFFDPKTEKNRLTAHMYKESDDVRTLRSMENLHLVDFVELTLKGTEGFEKAINNLLDTKLADYMKKYIVFLPGDWPAQFFFRKIIYSKLNKENGQNLTDPLLSLIPLLGPLHVSLNAIEDVFLTFSSFFREIYAQIFPGRKPLAEKPKAWRISLLLELLYGGWTKIRETVLQTFKGCKDIRYATLINLLDNYIPLVLSIYGVILRANNFKQYLNAMIRVWTLFYSFRRRHYDKAPLVWISNVLFWMVTFPEIYQIFCNYITITDEYGVENTHSIIRSKTKSFDSVAQLIKKVKTIFHDKRNLQNFQSSFMPPKNFTFSQKNIDTLKGKTANILIEKFKEIATKMQQDDDEPSTTDRKKLQEAFGESFNSPHVLPLGYQSPTPPNDKCRCDMPGCQYYQQECLDWKIIEGCWHSFHLICLKGRNYCPLCKSHLAKEIRRLGKKAQEGIFGQDQGNDTDHQEHEDIDADDDNDNPAEVADQGFDHAKLTELQNIRPKIPGIVAPSTNVRPSNQPTEKPSHCKTCGHVVKGHKRPKNQLNKCPLCPGQICSANGCQITCDCQWHQPVVQEAEPLLVSAEKTITVFSFPESQSQATLSTTQASNACTPISLLISSAVYSNTMPELSLNNPKEIQDFYVNKIKQGNLLYDIIDQPVQQPNLEVDEVLESIKMPVKVGPGGFIGIMDLPQFKTELERMFDNKENMSAVMITPPDKSFTLCKTQNKLVLFESHHHYLRGSLIAFTDSQNIEDFCDYVNNMITNDWKKSLQFSNLTPIVIDNGNL